MLYYTIIFFTACKKGDVGPEGPVGVDGPPGPTGNANVRIYTFGVRNISNDTTEYKLPNLSKGFVDSSLVLAYYEISSTWYPVAGLGVSGNYNTRYTLFQDNPSPSSYIMRIMLYKPNMNIPYGTPVTWDRFKIIVVPASVVIAGP